MRASASRGIPAVENVFKTTFAFGQHTLIINLDGYNVDAARAHSLHGICVAVLLNQHSLSVIYGVPVLVPLISQSLDDLGEAIGRAAGQDNFGTAKVRNIGVEVLSGELADKLVERRVTLGGAVLQSRVQVYFPQEISGS